MLNRLFLVQIWHNTTHDKKVFTNSTFCDIIIKTKRVDKLACQRASADCSASVLRLAKQSAKHHLERGVARKEYKIA